MSGRSSELFDLAEQIVALWPLELEADIAVTGSVSKGYADTDSDIELNFWTPTPLQPTIARAWLASCGVEQVWADPNSDEDTVWLEFRWADTWVEAAGRRSARRRLRSTTYWRGVGSATAR